MVLIVEDDFHKLASIEQIAEEAGLLSVSRLTAVDGVWFLRQYFDVGFDRRTAPRLVGVITDWNMPRRFGEQITKGAGDMVLREMRQHPGLPVIVFSGDSRPHDVAHDVTWCTSDRPETLLAWLKAIVPREDKA
jgi:CheY-like chemotaxis protein